MITTCSVSPEVLSIRVIDESMRVFEGQYPVQGMCFNTYLILSSRTALFDGAESETDEWLDTVKTALNGRELDYYIVSHVEPDHSVVFKKVLAAFPGVKIVGNAKTFAYLSQFYGEINAEKVVVSANQTFSVGTHVLRFVFAPMVHWPEVMFTYDESGKVLFSADAFGYFGTAFDVGEARRYYINIVGKYGAQVSAVLKAASALEILTVCPLHGEPLAGEKIAYVLSKYALWSSYEPEQKGVFIAYNTVYGNTEKAALLLEKTLKESGVKCEIMRLNDTDVSYAVSKAFEYSHLVICATTYDASVFPCSYEFIRRLSLKNFQNRTVAVIENGTWVPMVNKTVRDLLASCKNLTFIDDVVTIKSAMTEQNAASVAALAEKLK